MAKKARLAAPAAPPAISTDAAPPRVGRPSALLDTRVVYCGDNLEQLAKLPDACVDLIYIDPPFNSNRTIEERGEVFWGETKEKRSFADRRNAGIRHINECGTRAYRLRPFLSPTLSRYA